MNTQIRAILLVCLLTGSSIANVVLEGLGADEISGYIVSPVIGISRIHLHRKFRRQVNLHIPLIPYVDESKTQKLSPVVTKTVAGDEDDDIDKSPVSENFFQFDEDQE